MSKDETVTIKVNSQTITVPWGTTIEVEGIKLQLPGKEENISDYVDDNGNFDFSEYVKDRGYDPTNPWTWGWHWHYETGENKNKFFEKEHSNPVSEIKGPYVNSPNRKTVDRKNGKNPEDLDDGSGVDFSR